MGTDLCINGTHEFTHKRIVTIASLFVREVLDIKTEDCLNLSFKDFAKVVYNVQHFTDNLERIAGLKEKHLYLLEKFTLDQINEDLRYILRVFSCSLCEAIMYEEPVTLLWI
ncbi:MAG: hypothetical protein IJ341_02210 [Bacteroidales bacterium]|nr:hypothetical protein [Bacteroidales bacterium]